MLKCLWDALARVLAHVMEAVKAVAQHVQGHVLMAVRVVLPLVLEDVATTLVKE